MYRQPPRTAPVFGTGLLAGHPRRGLKRKSPVMPGFFFWTEGSVPEILGPEISRRAVELQSATHVKLSR